MFVTDGDLRETSAMIRFASHAPACLQRSSEPGGRAAGSGRAGITGPVPTLAPAPIPYLPPRPRPAPPPRPRPRP
jgi:hypothetical protein